MSHTLQIDVKDGVNDNRFIHVSDLSSYDDMLEKKHRILQVLPPFTDEYIKLPFPEHQQSAYSTVHLGLTPCDAGDMPDGLYIFHFSISPNDKVCLQHYHFRTAVLMNSVLSKMLDVSIECRLAVDQCGNAEISKFQNMLLHVWMLLKGAEAAGSHPLRTEHAKDLYDQAQRAFNRLYNLDNCKVC
jgi:hypothetical protein